MSGREWTPPCLAVKRLRDALFRDYWTQRERAAFAFWHEQEDESH
jgi:hypothetical protein